MTDLAKYADIKICVAVSGGKDSMALLHYLYTHKREYGITLSALNCDHKIRGEASARDSGFVRNWCAERGIPLIFFEWETEGARNEVNARSWRLTCYLNAAKPQTLKDGTEWQGADAVATAHHLNDNAETVLFNLARGSALSGMEGITDTALTAEGVKHFKIIHPLIACSREEIDDYIKTNDVPFVDDETNFTDEYTRNKIRHNVLPELEKAVPGAAKAIYRFSRLAADDEEYFDSLIKKRKLIKHTRLGWEISHCREKVIFKRAVIKALAGANVKDYSSEHAQRLYELQFAEKGKKFEFLSFTAFKEEGKISICETHLMNAPQEGIPFKEHIDCELCFWNDTFIHVSQGKELDTNLLAFEAAAQDDERVPKKLKVLKFDLGAIPETAVIRFMKTGDKFTKFGGGTKNLGDYFTDKKIAVRIRKRIPLIADGSEVLAVGGVEISDRIKITEDTENTVYLICEDYTIMKNIADILEVEEKYKKLLVSKLSGDNRIALSCPEFKYPEPAFVYIKSVKTDKSIAVRLDGVDNTMRFWDYVDDDYSEEDGVWDKMTEKGLENFIQKLYKVMDKAFDIEFYNLEGECEDYYSGVAGFEPTAENAQKAVRKVGKGMDFVFAKFSGFFGNEEYVFDKTFKQIKR